MKTIIKGFFSRHMFITLISALFTVSLLITGGMIKSIKSSLESIDIISSPTIQAADKTGDASNIQTGKAEGESKPEMPADAPVSAGIKYVVREYCGKLGIFAPDSDIPDEVIPVFVAYLPISDKAALEHGIEIRSAAELARLIDDFRS